MDETRLDFDQPFGVGVSAALAVLRAYKLLISPLFAGSCRFLPSCADYTREAVLGHGVLRGSWLGARRLVRCHPMCAGGHDPVPVPHKRPLGLRYNHGPKDLHCD